MVIKTIFPDQGIDLCALLGGGSLKPILLSVKIGCLRLLNSGYHSVYWSEIFGTFEDSLINKKPYFLKK